MNNDLLRYRLLLESYGTFDVSGRMWQMIQMFLVDLPFRLLTILVSGVSFFLDLIDFTDSFATMRQSFFDQSRHIFLGFIGGTSGRIATGTIGFAFLSIALLYLIWHFFFGRDNFSKKAIHVIVVILLAFAYFGSFNEGGRNVSGGIWLLDTVDNVATELRANMITSFTFDDTIGSPTEESASLSRYFESHVVRNSWRFLHSGSFQGEYAPGQFLDESRMIPAVGLSGNELDQFESDRENYLRELARTNPYVRNSPEYLMQKMFMVFLSYANLLVLGLPIVFVNLTISAFQLVLLVLILLFPFALLLSFIPFMRNAAFRVLKMMMGILLLPVLLSFLLGVIFYLNQVIDSFILSRAGVLLGTGALTMSALPAGNALLILFFVMVAVKGFFFHLLWKHKGRLLQLLSDGQLDDRMMNQPKQVIDNAKEKVKETSKKVADKAVGVGKVALGVTIANPGLMADGIVQTCSSAKGSRRAMTNVIGNHFVGEDGKVNIKEGYSSLKEKAFGGIEKPNSLYASSEQDKYNGADGKEIQDVKVTNPDELKSEAKNDGRDHDLLNRITVENSEPANQQRENVDLVDESEIKVVPSDEFVIGEQVINYHEHHDTETSTYINPMDNPPHSMEMTTSSQFLEQERNELPASMSDDSSSNRSNLSSERMESFLQELRDERLA